MWIYANMDWNLWTIYMVSLLSTIFKHELYKDIPNDINTMYFENKDIQVNWTLMFVYSTMSKTQTCSTQVWMCVKKIAVIIYELFKMLALNL